MNNTVEILGEILTQFDTKQNQYIKKYDERSDDYMECIHIVRQALVKLTSCVKQINFDKLVDRRTCLIKKTLQQKESEYASDDDRFHNFKVAGKKRNQTPEQALVGMMVKHEVSVDDLVEWAGTTPERITTELIDEKIGDNIVYLVLLEGLLRERIGG